MNENLEHIEDLIGKFIVGEASEIEIRKLREWCALSDENQKYLEDAKLIFQRAQLPGKQEFDADAAWNKVKNQIHGKEKKSWFIFPTWGIAAGLILIFAFTFIFYSIRQSSQNQEFNFTADLIAVTQRMPDLTEISLNKNSDVRVDYDERKKTGTIHLSGEALINIPDSKKVNWTVQTGELQIEDIGTVFHVKAFPNSAIVEVTVQEGRVRFYKENMEGISLSAGEKGTYDKNLNTFSKLEADPNVAAFVTRSFTFQEEELGQVLNSLSEVYGKKIVMEGDISGCRLTVAFENEDLDTILGIIAETLGLEVSDEGSQIKISGDGCF
ncbi:FecR family protein [Aquiflexum balticum DSM 16537]|uniref:FecR family protein n=1 Tax=Aquiflexum balticum DSM 16537 TaxID=758820 RepID=A0A1W2H5J3_9BACT|nr:FecR domain-containing protein [Aquiflexum balticum]SMD43888.1 FecR family protein [Aquiflexum balticum DSM 16537]